MKKIYRTMLLFSSTVIFLAVAPLIVLYALGYRVGTSAIDPLPVSVLQLESFPGQARIDLNGQTRGETPQTISGLTPGPVTITVSKPDYEPWSKSVTVEPGFATEFRDIRLFRRKPQAITMATAITMVTLSPNRKLIAAVDQKNLLYFFDEDGLAIGTPLRLPTAPLNALWSPDSVSLLLTYRRSHAQVVAVSTRPQIKTLRAVPSSVSHLVWDPRIPGRLLLINLANELWAVNHMSDSAQFLLGSAAAMTTTSRSIIVSQTDGSLTFLTLQGQLTTRLKPSTSRPITDLHATPGGNLAFRTDDTHVYYLGSAEQIISVADQSERLGWSPNGHLLYIQTTPNELSIWNTEADTIRWLPAHTLHLAVRLSQPLLDPQWFAGNRHLMYQVDDAINITEIDTRDRALTYRLDTTNLGAAQATVGRDGKVVFYLKKEGNKTSLVRTKIAE